MTGEVRFALFLFIIVFVLFGIQITNGALTGGWGKGAASAVFGNGEYNGGDIVAAEQPLILD